jgi:hypothetical protein
MPIDYKNYPANWKTEIRPAILQRAQNKCEQCGVKNASLILRGHYAGKSAYQDLDGFVFCAETGKKNW